MEALFLAVLVVAYVLVSPAILLVRQRRMAARLTDLSEALHRVPLMGRCRSCGAETHIEHYNFTCPACHTGQLDILSGREMQVEYLEVE